MTSKFRLWRGCIQSEQSPSQVNSSDIKMQSRCSKSLTTTTYWVNTYVETKSNTGAESMGPLVSHRTLLRTWQPALRVTQLRKGATLTEKVSACWEKTHSISTRDSSLFS